MKIFVSGIGVISAIGLNSKKNYEALRSGDSGIKYSSKHHLMLGEVPLSNEELEEMNGVKGRDFSRTTLLALNAVKEAWGANKISSEIRTGFISSTSVGGLDKMEEYYFQYLKESNSDYHSKMIFDNGTTSEEIANELGISGFVSTLSTACSSGPNAILYGARLLELNRLDRVVVGGCDPLALFDLKGFSSLNIYDKNICKPFDQSRKGLNIGEAAGYLVLENEKSLVETGNKVLCVLSGWNNSTDAYHQTASSPNGKGATLAMNRALEKAMLDISDIDYINAHGTGTENNDLSEAMAFKNVFGNDVPSFSSTKGYTGHTLAAAGAIEAVYCVLSLLHQAKFSNLNFTEKMKDIDFCPQLIHEEGVSVNHVLSNSFGFGGNCSSLIFSKN